MESADTSRADEVYRRLEERGLLAEWVHESNRNAAEWLGGLPD